MLPTAQVDATQPELRAVEEARSYLEDLRTEISGQGVRIELAVPTLSTVDDLCQRLPGQEEIKH